MDASSTLVPSSIAGVILAGGRATRMGGGDKCLIPVRGRAVISWILEALRPQVGTTALNANGDPGRFAGLGAAVVADGVAGQPGPLAGVLAGLDWAAAVGFGWVVTVPGDGPFLPGDLVARLWRVQAGGFACAGSGGRRHPVTALWPVECRERLRAALEAGERRVQAFTGRVPVAWWEMAGGVDPFANLNTPADIPD